MKIHAILLTLEDHPGQHGHTRSDTIENDIITSLERHGYENVTIVAHDTR